MVFFQDCSGLVKRSKLGIIFICTQKQNIFKHGIMLKIVIGCFTSMNKVSGSLKLFSMQLIAQNHCISREKV